MPKRVYIAGPYSKGDQAQNVRRVLDFAEVVANCGMIPFVPHLSHFWHLVHPHDIDFWYAYDLEWLKQCDILVRLSGESRGADEEVMWAREWDIPVIISPDGSKAASLLRGLQDAAEGRVSKIDMEEL